MDGAELLAPAGDFETALAAFDAGADAVYCGLSGFSARAFAKNLSTDELRSLVRVARRHGKQVYVTFNTVVGEGEADEAVRLLAELEEIGPTALIVQDIGVARLCRRHFPGLALHASTQLAVHNLEGVMAMRELGFERVVLARELSLDEISFISKRCGGMELECFIHGALCYSVSGLCLFSAMEKGRSGNRGRCAYCCRMPYPTEPDGPFRGGPAYIFSMKDLRLGEDARKLVEAGVKSLKIEGRMKSSVYVASVTAYYRAILDGRRDGPTIQDLETVFSRSTTPLYLEGRRDDVIDPGSIGHKGAAIGTVKRVTRDRDGVRWLRFHTSRALERHDGLQFASPSGGKSVGFGISDMRTAMSRSVAFEVPAGADVEIRLPDEESPDLAEALKPGATVYCSMSNAVRRRFPVPSFRPGDYPGDVAVDVRLEISPSHVAASAKAGGAEVEASVDGAFEPSKNPEKTFGAVEKAFSRLGGSDYSLGKVEVSDPDRLFVPMSTLNDLRREVVERLDGARASARSERISAALEDDDSAPPEAARDQQGRAFSTLKVRVGQKVPKGDWDEVVVAISPSDAGDFRVPEGVPETASLRLALPVYTPEGSFGALRVAVKRLVRAGYSKWEAADFAGLRLLRALGIEDITADWTLYAQNVHALRQLSEMGARRFVASPEASPETVAAVAESGYDVEFLSQQSTPLFISLTRPAAMPAKESALSVFCRDGLWVTTRVVPRTFKVPQGASSRIDLSWSPQ